MRWPFGRSVSVALVIGGVAGCLAVLAAEETDRLTSSDAFCTSCHSMSAYVADDAYYQTSLHRITPTGVRAGCADCHIPPGLVAATWAHVKGGVKDVWVEATTDFSVPSAWEERRTRLAAGVREWMKDTNSATCLRCHEKDAIKPKSEKGKAKHSDTWPNGTACVSCHENLVHSPHRSQS